jgi:hypothetical protein
MDFGAALPFQGDRGIGFRSMQLSVFIINGMTLGMVAIYFHLLHENETTSLEQKKWLQRTARMQELLQMSNHFAMKTNGPLEILGTALHNLEEPLYRHAASNVLLGMLAPVESSAQELASVARSFSLFSQRDLHEGLEQTSFNHVLQHVDTIYNVGAVQGRTLLHWEKVNPDILIYTQTAKLVMLIISVMRRTGAEGGTQLQVLPFLDANCLLIKLHYRVGSGSAAALADRKLVFDPELNADLILELCADLDIECTQQREGDKQVYCLKLLQARLA